MHAIERELIKATGYKAKRPFSDREDYLKSLLNDVMKLSDEDFDALSEEAATWSNAAVEAHNSKNGTIPDFDEVEASEDDAEPEPEADAEDETSEDDGDPESDEEAAGDEIPDDDEELSEDETEEAASEDEEEPAPKPAKKKVAAKPKAKEKVPAKKPVAEKPAPKAKKKASDDDDVVLDKWGCMEGSKNSRALAMFEKGATSKEVKDAIGGTFYNILKRAEQNGHRLEKDGAVFKLIHKDTLNKAKAPVKKAGKK